MTLVSRLEEFSEKEIEISGHEKIVQYRGSLLPLISLDSFFKINMKSDKNQTADSRKPVIVVARGDKFFGLMVSEIVDILTLASDLNSHLKETQGILGTLVTNNKKTTTVIDALSILRQVTGDKTPEAKLVKFKKAKILFAEDTAFFVKQIKKVLEAAGLEVVHVPDGEAALNQIEQNPPGTFSLILSDIEMPKMNGFELATAIRKNSQFAKIPMIAMTTRFRESDIAHGKQVGFNKYLEKLHSDELLNAVGELLGGTA